MLMVHLARRNFLSGRARGERMVRAARSRGTVANGEVICGIRRPDSHLALWLNAFDPRDPTLLKVAGREAYVFYRPQRYILD